MAVRQQTLAVLRLLSLRSAKEEGRITRRSCTGAEDLRQRSCSEVGSQLCERVGPTHRAAGTVTRLDMEQMMNVTTRAVTLSDYHWQLLGALSLATGHSPAEFLAIALDVMNQPHSFQRMLEAMRGRYPEQHALPMIQAIDLQTDLRSDWPSPHLAG